MVLCGILFGLFVGTKFEAEQIAEIYKSYDLYLLFAIMAIGYNWFFKKIYTENGYEMNIKGMLLNMISSFIKLMISSLLAISFVSLISFT